MLFAFSQFPEHSVVVINFGQIYSYFQAAIFADFVTQPQLEILPSAFIWTWELEAECTLDALMSRIYPKGWGKSPVNIQGLPATSVKFFRVGQRGTR